MIKIGIEAHTIEKEEKFGAGGNYLGNLIVRWGSLNPEKYRMILYFKDRIPDSRILDSPVFEKKIARNPFGIKSTAFFYNFSLPHFAKKDKVDVLFLPFYMQPAFCWIPTVATVHDISFKVHPEWFGWQYLLPFSLLTKLAIKKASAIITPSVFSKNEIVKYYGSSGSKIYPIYLAAGDEFAVGKNKDKIREIKRILGIKDKYFFYTGTIFNRRHVKECMEAFAEFFPAHRDYQFLISGRDMTYPAQEINRLAGDINKKFPGAILRESYVDQNFLPFIYQGAELFVWPSEYEGFGLPVIEAMACGTLVLTTRLTSLAELTDDSAFIVENPGSSKDIARKMEEAASNSSGREDVIKKGLSRVAEFSWTKCAEETLEIIKNAIC